MAHAVDTLEGTGTGVPRRKALRLTPLASVGLDDSESWEVVMALRLDEVEWKRLERHSALLCPCMR